MLADKKQNQQIQRVPSECAIQPWGSVHGLRRQMQQAVPTEPNQTRWPALRDQIQFFDFIWASPIGQGLIKRNLRRPR